MEHAERGVRILSRLKTPAAKSWPEPTPPPPAPPSSQRGARTASLSISAGSSRCRDASATRCFAWQNCCFGWRASQSGGISINYNACHTKHQSKPRCFDDAYSACQTCACASTSSRGPWRPCPDPRPCCESTAAMPRIFVIPYVPNQFGVPSVYIGQ